MDWTRLRWTDLRDNLLVALQTAPSPSEPASPVRSEIAPSSKVAGEDAGRGARGHLATSAITAETSLQLPGFGGLCVRRSIWPADVPVDEQRDRVLVPEVHHEAVARVIGPVLVDETVRRLREAGRDVPAEPGGGDGSGDEPAWWVALDLPARAGAYAVAPDAEHGIAVRAVRSAIAWAGMTPVPLPWPGEADEVRGRRVSVRLGVGVARRPDGRISVPWDDLKQVSRIVEALLLREDG